MDVPVQPSEKPSRAWCWVPSLYFAEGIPYVIITAVSGVMYKNLGLSNTQIAFFTSWLGLPWVLKACWAPLVDMFGCKRFWIVSLQFLMGIGFSILAYAVPAPHFVQISLSLFFLLAFISATHDIAADGYYLLALPPHGQAAFVGVRSIFYKLATIAGQGGLVWLAGRWMTKTSSALQAWTWVFTLLAGSLFLMACYHLLTLPRSAADRPTRSGAVSRRAEFGHTFYTFFAKPHIGKAIFFLLAYRLAEAQALKLVQPFLLDTRAIGGLGLTNEQVGIAYGVVALVALLLGGLLGGYLISKHGLKRMLWPMLVGMHVPIVIFVLLAIYQPTHFVLICASLAVEQFGYGFGFTAYMVFMMMIARGNHQTAHYAICTGFMAAGILLPGMAAGWIQDHLGYSHFFVWAVISTLPSFFATALLKIDPAFGKKAAVSAGTK